MASASLSEGFATDANKPIEKTSDGSERRFNTVAHWSENRKEVDCSKLVLKRRRNWGGVGEIGRNGEAAFAKVCSDHCVSGSHPRRSKVPTA